MFRNLRDYFPSGYINDNSLPLSTNYCLLLHVKAKEMASISDSGSEARVRLANQSASTCDEPSIDVNKLVYRFDPDSRWTYFRDGAPLASSVERGPQKTRSKLQKVYVNKQRKITARKNRPYRELARMSLICSCDQGCLMRRPPGECRQLIHVLRQNFYQKSYNEQNYILSGLMEVSVCPSGVRRVTYRIPTLGTVCRGAFEKCYAISDAKIKVLLRKMNADGVTIQQDMRGRHGNNARKLLPEARRAVIDFICSHKADASHYRRARTQKRYFDSNVSMRKMWRDFVAKNPDFKTNRSQIKNRGPVISFSSFRNIFNLNLRDMLSFRKARIDTCQYCDQMENQINTLCLEIKNGIAERVSDLERLRQEHDAHKLESETRFASQKYDMVVLSKRR